jgi:elongation factor Ts
MSSLELLKELRSITQAGMKDCRDALTEAEGDLQKAIDIIKTKGQNIVSGREGKVAADGLVGVAYCDDRTKVMVEVNCQTDFVAKSPDFKNFVDNTAQTLLRKVTAGDTFATSDVEGARTELVATTKENIVIRQWWAEQAASLRARVFAYVHTNQKIATLITLLAPTEELAASQAFEVIGIELAMQVTAMNPLAVSSDRLPSDVIARQKSIFETQLKELNKPESTWAKILDGKLNKWYSEVCLLKQESVIQPKTTVEQMINNNYSHQLGGVVEIVNFIRCQVGEGIETQKTDLVAEVSKLSGVSQ